MVIDWILKTTDEERTTSVNWINIFFIFLTRLHQMHFIIYSVYLNNVCANIYEEFNRFFFSSDLTQLRIPGARWRSYEIIQSRWNAVTQKLWLLFESFDFLGQFVVSFTNECPLEWFVWNMIFFLVTKHEMYLVIHFFFCKI